MLSALRIQHFATIDNLEVAFGQGFTVLTGETGAGKSILVDALQLALGGRAQPDLVRTGCNEAVVEAVFEAGPKLRLRMQELGLPDGPELLIRRLVPRTGRSKVWINGSLCTVSVLEQLARKLCDISSQLEHVSLLDPSSHLEILDAHGGLVAEREEYAQEFAELSALVAQRQTLLTDETERERRADYLKFQLEEIDELDPKPDEDAMLTAERTVLASAAKIQSLAQGAEEVLYSGDGAVTELLGGVVTRLVELSSLDPSFAPLHATLVGAAAEVEEAARDLQQAARQRREDPSRLAALDDRLVALRKLVRKHGGDLAAVITRRQQMSEELATLLGHTERLAGLEGQEAAARERAAGLAAKLSGKRQKAAARLSQALVKQLAKVDLKTSRFEVRLESAPLSTHGQDAAEFYFSANPGEELRPLARIASGGELSRLMLAFKRAERTADPVDIYVFDEVDSGIGGATAQVVGRMLKEVAADRQVLCITHLPQIAAFADCHLVVKKSVTRGRTVSAVVSLGEKERFQEVARMLDGDAASPIALQHAQDLLRRSSASA